MTELVVDLGAWPLVARANLLSVDEELEASAGLTDLVDRHVSERRTLGVPADFTHLEGRGGLLEVCDLHVVELCPGPVLPCPCGVIDTPSLAEPSRAVATVVSREGYNSVL
jgi:hypothetical protein